MTNQIRELRAKAGLTQAEVGKVLDAAPSEVSRWERGDRLPSATTIDRLAKLFKVSSWRLFIKPTVRGKRIRIDHDSQYHLAAESD